MEAHSLTVRPGSRGYCSAFYPFVLEVITGEVGAAWSLRRPSEGPLKAVSGLLDSQEIISARGCVRI